ncbi:MAG: nucleic acid-binding protein contains domain-like protein [Phycisphaerales bacterium]|nr:nucleic acid-binding protein contains domain-like protein [Phycisphaerales bacterium]
MKLVLDTNILVSGLLRPAGPPGAILQQAAAGVHRICFDDRILEEYREVLARPRFAFNQDDVEALLDQLETDGIPVLCDPLSHALPDRDDEKFLEAAIAASAEFLVTGNLRHFPEDLRCGVRAIAPREFLDLPGV